MSKDTISRKVNVTKDYRLFGGSDENRPLDIKKHRKLEQSMAKYGFLPCFPVVCFRNADKKLIIKDGQHRLAIAETLGLPVYWIEETIDFDIAVINCTPKTWALRDYAQKYAASGIKAYQEGIDFCDENHLSIGFGFSLLAGTTSFGNIKSPYVDGEFKIKDRAWANAVVGIYVPMIGLSSAIRNDRFIEACMAVCRVEIFDAKRLLHNAERCRDKLVSYSTREAYLDMLEQVYNFGRNKLVGLKAEATMAMRDRNAVVAKRTAKEAKNEKAA